MIKKELVDSVSETTGLSKTDVLNYLEAITSIITNTVANGEKVTIRGFGQFHAVSAKPKIVRDFSSGKHYTMPLSKKVKFKAYDTFINALK